MKGRAARSGLFYAYYAPSIDRRRYGACRFFGHEPHNGRVVFVGAAHTTDGAACSVPGWLQDLQPLAALLSEPQLQKTASVCKINFCFQLIFYNFTEIIR